MGIRAKMPHIKFYGSQVGGEVVTPHSYTGSPAELLRHDIWSALSLVTFFPFIVWPMRPARSGEMCELYPSWKNLWSMFLHLILILLQLPFILSIPLWIFVPVPVIIAGCLGFWLVNSAVVYLLNGSQMRYQSNPQYAKARKEHQHEQWLFLNGVAVGKYWMQSNIDRLALTFGRPILGVHNKTGGILFDTIQCLVQRNFNYATSDVRECYAVVKETLYKSDLTKVVFIMHSQGAIEGGMIIDWLLQEVPQDLLAKLEVYSFGNAANHFNNPHLHLLSQHAALSNPKAVSTTRTMTQVHYHDPIAPLDSQLPHNYPNSTRSSRQTSSSGKTIRYIEHYAHTSDFVARWGVLHFVCNISQSPTAPRFMGRVFERPGQGHQLNQHYLDSMFPLKPSPPDRPGIGGSGFEGVDEESEFMDTIVEWGKNNDEQRDEREGLALSYLGAKGEPLDTREEVLLRDMSPVSPESTLSALRGEFENGRGFTNAVNGDERREFKVRDLSRLWSYRNGRSPKTDEVDVGIARMSTI